MGLFSKWAGDKEDTARDPVEPTIEVAAQSPASQEVITGAGGQAVTISNDSQSITSPEQLEAFLRGKGLLGPGSAGQAMRQAAVWRANSLICGAIGSMPLVVGERVSLSEHNLLQDHWAWRLLRRKVNNWQTPSEWRKQMQTHLHFRGNGYSLIVWNALRTEAMALLPLDPDRMTVEQMEDQSLVYEYKRKNGGTITFPAEDILHLRGLTVDGVVGMSVFQAARQAIAMAGQMQTHGNAILKNGARVGLVMQHPKSLSQPAYDRLKQSLEEYEGPENAGKSLITEEGIETKALAMTNADAQFLESRKFQRNEIAMFFGVPPFLLGDTESTTSWGSGIEQQSIGFVTYTLGDWLTTWEETLIRDLMAREDPEIYVEFLRSAITRGDTKTRWDSYTKGLQWGVYSPNDVRAAEGLNPRDGGDIYYPPPNTAGRSSSGAEPETEGESNDT